MNDYNYTINYSPQFREELRKIYHYFYFSLASPQIADKLLEKFKHFISSLDLFPERYSRVSLNPNSKYHNLRKMPVDKYVILYEVNNINRTVYILHIFYGRQNYLYYI